MTQEITPEIQAEPLVTPTAPLLSWLRQVTGADEEDWLDDPRLWRMLAERDRHVAAEILAGQWTTLEALQERWTRKKARAKAKKRPTS